MSRSLSLSLFLFVAVFAAGCAGSRTATVGGDLPAAFPEHSLAQVLAQLEPLPDTLGAFRAKTNFALNTPQRAGRFSGELVHRRGDSLYLSLSPGLGIEAARALITPDSFFLYNRIDKELIYGDVDLAAEYLPAAFTADDLFRNLLGMPRPEPNVDWTLDADAQYYYLRSPDETRIYTIDPTLWRVARYEERSADGRLVEDRMFLEWDTFEGHLLPRRLIFRRPMEKSSATLYYRDIEFNPASLAFDLRVRSDAKRIPAEALMDR